MSITNTLGCIDTPIAGNPAIVSLPLAQINFGADFRKKDQTDTFVRLVNTKAPLDTPESINVSVDIIPDIYKNSKIDPAARFAGKGGVRIVSKVTNTLKVVDSALPLEPQFAECSAHLVIQGPDSLYFTPDIIKQLMQRCISSFFETGSAATTRISDLQRGILLPDDVN